MTTTIQDKCFDDAVVGEVCISPEYKVTEARVMAYADLTGDHTPVHTVDLPDTPTRDRNIVASAWIEAPPELGDLADDLDGALVAAYKRRIGDWLLWRAGPATGGDARYWACRRDDLAVQCTFRLFPDGTGSGLGPSGSHHVRFRAWKEDLLGRSED